MKLIILGLILFACFCLSKGWILPTPPKDDTEPPTYKGDHEEPLFHNGLPCVRDKNSPGNGSIPKGYRLADPHPTRTLPPHPDLPYPFRQPTISNP